MDAATTITRITFEPANAEAVARGLLYKIAFNVGRFRVSNVLVRRSASGRVYLSYRQAVIRPVSDADRLALEIAVITRLRLRSDEVAP
jgi:hypothetical protein